MPSTYEPIATTTLGSAASSVTFSSISGSYTDLVLVISAASSTVDNFAYVQLNSDTTDSNYSWTSLYGTGSSAASGRGTKGYINSFVGIGSDFNSTVITNFMNYSNSTTYKTLLSRSGRSTGGGSYLGTEGLVTLWRNTAAITSIKVNAFSTYTFSTGSTFTLYGIKAA
jgi:hypothetical protein